MSDERSRGTEARSLMAGARPHDENSGKGTTDELGGLVVLVVDDEAVVRAYVARALTIAGMDVAVAADGREALRLVAEDRVRPAVVVTDIEMPAMTGVELAARLLAIRPSIRIVMMTGDAERAEAARRHPAIVDQVILKPMRLEAILDAVRSAAAADLDSHGRGRTAPSLGVRSSGAPRVARRAPTTRDEAAARDSSGTRYVAAPRTSSPGDPPPNEPLAGNPRRATLRGTRER